VTESVELAYAATAHRVQGMTTDTAHALITPEMTREALYVTSTRGRERTTWYTATEAPLDLDCHTEPDPPRTAREVLAAVLARTGAEQSATQTIRGTLEDAGSVRTLVARYRHARDVAAGDALRLAAGSLDPRDAARVLADPAAPQLARELAAVSGHGVDPGRLLRTAWEWDEMDAARSPALVLAARIQDQAATLGIPHQPPADAPLPWLPAPDVGHPGWLPYLSARAQLIRDRAQALASLPAAYREQYGVTDADTSSLGEEPESGTARALAYRVAAAHLPPPPQAPDSSPHRDPRSAPAPAPIRSSMSQPRGPRLSR
jgi:hypothetical protein